MFGTAGRRRGRALDAAEPPYVVKHDGLAAGKGVIVTDDRARGASAARRPATGSSWRSSWTDPRCRCSASPTGRRSCRCCRRRTSSGSGDGDTGPNTGGMGAYAPLPWAPPALVDDVVERIGTTDAGEMAAAGHAVRRAALRRSRADAAGPRVIEFNAGSATRRRRSVLPLLATPLGGCCIPRRRAGWPTRAAASGGTARRSPSSWPLHGYPGAPRYRRRHRGVDDAAGVAGVSRAARGDPG